MILFRNKGLNEKAKRNDPDTGSRTEVQESRTRFIKASHADDDRLLTNKKRERKEKES